MRSHRSPRKQTSVYAASETSQRRHLSMLHSGNTSYGQRQVPPIHRVRIQTDLHSMMFVHEVIDVVACEFLEKLYTGSYFFVDVYT